MKTGKDRYLHDQQFRVLVDLMVGHIHQGDYTPSEMRDAAMTASLIVEATTLRSLTIQVEARRLEDIFPELRL